MIKIILKSGLYSLSSAAVLLFAVLNAGAMPLCIYDVNSPQNVKTVKKAGFNCMQTYKQAPQELSALAQAAEANGLKMLIYPDKLINSSELANANKWPILALYLYDEPDVARLSWRDVKKLDGKAKKALPGRQTAVVVGQGSHAENYCKSADILMVDWYPVPHLNLSSFGKQIEYAKKILAKNKMADKPLWGVIQAFDWKDFKQYRPDDQRIGRFPEKDEMLFMAYHGLIHGINGVFFYTFTVNGKNLPEYSPEYWKRLKAVIKELNKTLPIFEEGEILPAPGKTSANILAQRRLYKGYYYDFLLNLSEVQEPLPAEFMQKTYKALYRAKTKTLAPHSVTILRSKAK